MPTITIDGKEIEARDGQTVIEAAFENGIWIGHYCWHPGLSPEGNCRMCLVEVEKAPKLMPSCMTKVADGMVVQTEHTSAKVQVAQGDVMEFLLVDHPIDCPICDQVGECKLQDFYMQYDRRESLVPLETKLKKPKRVSFNEDIVYDGERCILCTRCVRFSREKFEEKAELGMINRGAISYIATGEGGEMTSNYAMNVIDICPVGALTSKHFRFRKRVFYMSSAKSVCSGCSRGCNIWSDYHHDEVFRFRPRENRQINEWWMCDHGRKSSSRINAEGRALAPLLRDGDGKPSVSSWEQSIARAADELKAIAKEHGNAAVAAVGSPHASTEENWLLKQLFAAAFPGAPVAFPAEDHYHEGKGDKWLFTADKSPNAAAGKALGFGASVEQVIAGIEQGKIKGLLVLGEDLLHASEKHPDLADRFSKATDKLSWLVSVSPFLHGTARRADAVLAAAYYLESTGTFINVDKRVQRFERSVRPAADARTAVEIFGLLAKRLGTSLPVEGGAAGVFNELAKQEKTFSGLNWESIGDQGAPLPS